MAGFWLWLLLLLPLPLLRSRVCGSVEGGERTPDRAASSSKGGRRVESSRAACAMALTMTTKVTKTKERRRSAGRGAGAVRGVVFALVMVVVAAATLALQAATSAHGLDVEADTDATSEESIRSLVLARLRDSSDASEAAGEVTTTRSPTMAPVVGVGVLAPVVAPAMAPAVNTTGQAAVAQWAQLPDWARYLLGIVLAVVGLVLVLAGYRLLPLTLFVVGGGIAAVIMFIILAGVVPDARPDKTTIVFWTCFGTWIAFGLLFACLIALAMFILGFAGGAILALVLNPVALKYVWPAQPLANLIIWILLFGTLCGVVVVYFKRPLVIVATSVGGSFVTCYAISLLAGTANIVWPSPTSTAWEPYAFLGGVVGLAILGCIVQFMTVGERDWHEKEA